MGDRPPRALLVMVGLAPFGCLGVAVLLAVSGVVTFLALRSVRSWPVVDGRVTQSRVETTGTTHRPAVTYAYEVDGIRYEGMRFGLNTTDGGTDPWMDNADRERALEWVSRHPPGTTVRVHVDPKAPSNAVLDPSTDASAAWVKWIIAAVFAGAGLAWRRMARTA